MSKIFVETLILLCSEYTSSYIFTEKTLKWLFHIIYENKLDKGEYHFLEYLYLGKNIDEGFDAVKGVGEAGTGPYSQVKGHHIHAKAAFKGDINYDLNKGFSISQDFMKNNGLSHSDMTTKANRIPWYSK